MVGTDSPERLQLARAVSSNRIQVHPEMARSGAGPTRSGYGHDRAALAVWARKKRRRTAMAGWHSRKRSRWLTLGHCSQAADNSSGTPGRQEGQVQMSSSEGQVRIVRMSKVKLVSVSVKLVDLARLSSSQGPLSSLQIVCRTGTVKHLRRFYQMRRPGRIIGRQMTPHLKFRQSLEVPHVQASRNRQALRPGCNCLRVVPGELTVGT